jgi:hypothetical protein
MPGVTVVASSPSSDGDVGWAVTGDDGRFTIGALQEGQYTISLADDQDIDLAWTMAPRVVTITASHNFHLKALTLTKGTLITGKVTDNSTGNPVSGLHVFASSAALSGGIDSKTGITGNDGVYTIRVAAGRAKVTTDGKHPPVPDVETPFDAKEGDTHTVDFRIADRSNDENQPTLHGIVLTPDGKPAAGATVLAFGTQQGLGSATTDANGQFQFYFAAQQLYTLQALSGDLGTPDPLVYKGEQFVTLTLGNGNLGRVVGTAIGSDGKPLAGVAVDLAICYRAGGREIADPIDEATTDSDGQYAFNSVLGNSDCQLTIATSGYFSAYASRVLAAAGKSVTAPSIEITKTVLGGIVLNANGKPVVNASLGSDSMTDGQAPFSAWTDLNGRFQIRGLPVAKYSVNVTSWQGGGGPFSLKPGRTNYVLRVGPD